MQLTVTMQSTFSAKWKPLTHIPLHSWQAFWGCARSLWGATAAGPAAVWLYSQNLHCHSWSEVWTACCAWCGAQAGGELASRPCGQQDKSAAGQTTVLYRHCRMHAHSVEPEMKMRTQSTFKNNRRWPKCFTEKLKYVTDIFDIWLMIRIKQKHRDDQITDFQTFKETYLHWFFEHTTTYRAQQVFIHLPLEPRNVVPHGTSLGPTTSWATHQQAN